MTGECYVVATPEVLNLRERTYGETLHGTRQSSPDQTKNKKIKAKTKQNKITKKKKEEEPTTRSSRPLPQANSVTYLILLLNKKNRKSEETIRERKGHSS